MLFISKKHKIAQIGQDLVTLSLRYFLFTYILEATQQASQSLLIQKYVLPKILYIIYNQRSMIPTPWEWVFFT